MPRYRMSGMIFVGSFWTSTAVTSFAQEWAMLQTRPEPNLTDQNDKQAKLMAVRQRMTDLLSKKV